MSRSHSVRTDRPACGSASARAALIRRRAAFLLTLLLLLSAVLSACGQKPSPAPASSDPAAESTGAAQPGVPDSTGAEPSAPEELSADGELITRIAGLPAAAPSDDQARVFYEIFVGSFSDSNGDGTGDLRGIIDRMDYLNDGDPDSGLSLGVEGIWLTPIFTSPSYHKYDVTDYYQVDPAFGTEDDLKELIGLCHERGVKLILDLPINHTGYKHAWFQSFRQAHIAGDRADPYYYYYCFCEEGQTPPAGRTFRTLTGTKETYECNFAADMPELDFDQPAVRQAVLDVAKYWLDLGVDGFRFDAAKYVYFGDNTTSADFWNWYLGELRAVKPDIWTVAEVWDGDGVTDMYYPALNCFDFQMAQTSGYLTEGAKNGQVGRLVNYTQTYLNKIRSLREDAQIVPFIANHDTDRAAGFLPVSFGQMQMAANLMLLGPGAPFLYYGEEIGMKGSRGGSNTDANRRLAMRWGDGDTVKDPEGADYPEKNQVKTTVQDQKADADSLYTYYKKLLMIRRANPEIAQGDYEAVTFRDSKAAGFIATKDGRSVCVLHNTTDEEVSVSLAEAGLTDRGTVTLQTDAGFNGARLSDDGRYVLTLGPLTSAVLRIEP